MVDPAVYKDYVLMLLFLKYLSDVCKDRPAKYEAEHPDHPDLVEAMMLQESYFLPPHASFDALHKRLETPQFLEGNSRRRAFTFEPVTPKKRHGCKA